MTVALLQYGLLNIAVYKTIKAAEHNGRIEQSVFDDYVKKMGLSSGTVKIINAQPAIGTYVQNLGDEETLEVELTYSLPLLKGKLDISLPVKMSGVNTGYYGGGY